MVNVKNYTLAAAGDFDSTGTYKHLQCHPESAVINDSLFLEEHNISLLAADHGVTLFGEMFPNSKFVQSPQCARTKTAALIQHQALLKYC